MDLDNTLDAVDEMEFEEVEEDLEDFDDVDEPEEPNEEDLAFINDSEDEEIPDSQAAYLAEGDDVEDSQEEPRRTKRLRVKSAELAMRPSARLAVKRAKTHA